MAFRVPMTARFCSRPVLRRTRCSISGPEQNRHHQKSRETPSGPRKAGAEESVRTDTLTEGRAWTAGTEADGERSGGNERPARADDGRASRLGGPEDIRHNGHHARTRARKKKRRPRVCPRASLEERRLPTLPAGVPVPSAFSGLTSLFGMGRGGSRKP